VRGRRGTTTCYEWVVEVIEEDGDHANVLDVHHASTYEEAEATRLSLDVGHRIDVGLCQQKYDEGGDLTAEAWAYLDEGKLPENFEDAWGVKRAKVPLRFHREIAARARPT
jgi:hypothetical protein